MQALIWLYHLNMIVLYKLPIQEKERLSTGQQGLLLRVLRDNQHHLINQK